MHTSFVWESLQETFFSECRCGSLAFHFVFSNHVYLLLLLFKNQSTGPLSVVFRVLGIKENKSKFFKFNSTNLWYKHNLSTPMNGIIEILYRFVHICVYKWGFSGYLNTTAQDFNIKKK